jgi:hypothetical protein
VISHFDDYCLHQTPDYIRVPGTTDRNFYDRYFFCGYRPDGSLSFGISFGRYPNRLVQDGHFMVVLDGHQHALHCSDKLGADPSDSRVGPLRVEVVEPMRILRCRVDNNDSHIACDLTFTAVSGAIDEGRLQVGREGINHIDQTRFMQYGSWQGWIEVDGRREHIAAGAAQGLRDKSWGVRLIGEQQADQQPGSQIFWMNIVMQLPQAFCVFRTLDHADGSSHEREGYSAPLYGSPDQVSVGEANLRRAPHWEFELDFAEGTRRISGGRYRISWEDGAETLLTGRALATFWYSGMGYQHQRWHHGLYHGEQLVTERESWPVAEVDFNLHERQFMGSVMEFSEAGQVVGYGHTEQLLMGAYQPLGWPAQQYTGLPGKTKGRI